MSDLQTRKPRVTVIKNFSTYLKFRKTGSLASEPSPDTNREEIDKTRTKKKKRKSNTPIIRVP